MHIEPRKALNKAFLKIKPNRSGIELFKQQLIQMLDSSKQNESEEFHKNLISDFLKNTYYSPNHFINTKGRNDLVIHTGKDAKSAVGVIIEAKSPSNKNEMISEGHLNSKALQEMVLYFLRERISHKNLEVKHLVATNLNQWFVFDGQLFDKLFAQNKSFVKQFQEFEEGKLSGATTDFFYKEIAKPFIETVLDKIEYTSFDLASYDKILRNTDTTDDTKLIVLYKLLSPEHLLKLSFSNDSNSLDKNFYHELLHLIGLTETKEGGKKLIGRPKKEDRHSGSLLENAINQHVGVVESAVVGYPHDIKGQAIYAFVVCSDHTHESEMIRRDINETIAKLIGPIAKADKIQIVRGLPKTRSGKIMRRILRKIAEGELDQLGDTSTLLDPTVVDEICKAYSMLG